MRVSWYHGFVRAADGTITTFDVAGAFGTNPTSINPSGTVTGSYDDLGRGHGFVRAADGAITTFDVAGAFGTNPTSINPSGTVTGSYDDLGGIHGFVRAVDGTLTTFFVDPPVPGTWSQSINPRGQITGWFRDLGQPGQPNTALRGFVRDTDGTLTTFAAPGASTLPFFGTQPVSINPKGEIVGYYRDDNGVFHGFLRKPDDHAGSGNTSDD